jgi:glycosyltransferase involved in cell wall biosynthesis
MPNIPKTPTPTLLVEQTIEYLGYQTFTVQKAPLPIRPLLMVDVAKLRFWENWYWKRADLLATMSEEDRQWILKRVQKARVEVVANGIDVSHFQETKPARPQNPTVLFVGNYKWLPNVDAAEYLIERIWPFIHKNIATAELRIVGRDVTDRIRRMGEAMPGVRVIGEVEDIRDALSRAHVMLVPIRNGRGTRYKILESMAARLPVVSTTLGIEGIRAKDGMHALIRDTDRGLAEATIKLLNERASASRLSQAAFELVTAHYNWETISTDLDRMYQKLGKRT